MGADIDLAAMSMEIIGGEGAWGAVDAVGAAMTIQLQGMYICIRTDTFSHTYIYRYKYTHIHKHTHIHMTPDTHIYTHTAAARC